MNMNPRPKSKPLNLWTVYKNPKDYPGAYVARRFETDQPTGECYAHVELNRVREWVIEQSLALNHCYTFCLTREPGDDPCILEVWM